MLFFTANREISKDCSVVEFPSKDEDFYGQVSGTRQVFREKKKTSLHSVLFARVIAYFHVFQ